MDEGKPSPLQAGRKRTLIKMDVAANAPTVATHTHTHKSKT